MDAAHGVCGVEGMACSRDIINRQASVRQAKFVLVALANPHLFPLTTWICAARFAIAFACRLS